MENVEYISDDLFEGCSNLESIDGGFGTLQVYLDYGSKIKVSEIEKLVNLKNLHIPQNVITDMNALENLTNLEQLAISGDAASLDCDKIGKLKI